MGEYATGWNAAIQQCVAIAERWRDENKAAHARALKSGRSRHAFDGDETQLVMADQLDGAAIECNAIAMEMRGLGIPIKPHVGSYDDPLTCYDCRQTIATAPASCDTHPTGGDSTEIEAPASLSGAVPEGQTPSPSPSSAAGK